jgi:hypothetical protein
MLDAAITRRITARSVIGGKSIRTATIPPSPAPAHFRVAKWQPAVALRYRALAFATDSETAKETEMRTLRIAMLALSLAALAAGCGKKKDPAAPAPAATEPAEGEATEGAPTEGDPCAGSAEGADPCAGGE